jgi:thermitase
MKTSLLTRLRIHNTAGTTVGIIPDTIANQRLRQLFAMMAHNLFRKSWTRKSLGAISSLAVLAAYGLANSNKSKIDADPSSGMLSSYELSSNESSSSQAAHSHLAMLSKNPLNLNKNQNTMTNALAINSDSESSVILNDPFIKNKWGLAKTNAQRAWEVSQGSREIVVAVIDTGADVQHNDLSENIWVNPGETGKDSRGRDKANNGHDDDGNGFVDDVNGWNFVHSNNQLTDNHGHGTHIAGIIGAKGGNGFGISGVSPNVSLMILKYYDPKAPNTNNLKNTIQAIRYAIKMKAHIINYSGGGTDYSAEEFAAVKEAERAGILFIAAAGNEKSNSDEAGKHYYPADYELSNIISVTAVNPVDTILASSNYGIRTVDMSAPGENIYSTLPNNSFGNMTGTSQATAFVTGVAALVMAHNREFSASAVKKYVMQTGDEHPNLLSKTGTAKLLNSFKALVSLDQGVGLTGVVASNTARMNPNLFTRTTTNTRDSGTAKQILSDENLETQGGVSVSDIRALVHAIHQSNAQGNFQAKSQRETKAQSELMIEPNQARNP